MYPKISLPFTGKFPVTFSFGEAPDWYVKIAGYPHNGVDFGMSIGQVIRACADGVVSYADSTPDWDGLGVNITHNFGLSQYWHLNELSVKAQTNVKKGQPIGISGASGWATGPHLHFGLKVKDVLVPGMRGWCDPLKFLDDDISEPDNEPAGEIWHVVLPGQSLWSIAQKYYGNGAFWRKIYNANLDKIKDPALIYPLQKLIIP